MQPIQYRNDQIADGHETSQLPNVKESVWVESENTRERTDSPIEHYD